jgi:hypothetical protein
MKLLYSKPEFVVIEHEPQSRTIIGDLSLENKSNKYLIKFPYIQLTYYKGLLFCTASSKPLASMKEQVSLSFLPNIFLNGCVCLRYGGLARDPKAVLSSFWSSPFTYHDSWPSATILKKFGFKSMRDYSVKSQKEDFDPCKLNWPKPSDIVVSGDVTNMYFPAFERQNFSLGDLPDMWKKDGGYADFLRH